MMMSTMMNPTNMMGMSGMATGPSSPTHSPAAMSGMMIPKCKIKIEKCNGGMKLHCVCEDKTAASMLQALCMSMPGAMCSCCCVMNGMTVCCCNMTMCNCKCEMTADGVCFTCITGDKACCEMTQACCDCCCNLLKAGCTCYVMLNNVPVCCGCC